MNIHLKKNWLIALILAAWGLQLIWLIWNFAPEVGDLGQRLLRGKWGAAIRQEDPFYLWVKDLADIIPPKATYIFLDRYEAGKEIEARYYLSPRRHILLSPQAPPSFLFAVIRRHQATYLIVRQPTQPPEPAVRTAQTSPAFRPVKLPGPGLVFKVDFAISTGDFYD